MRNGRDKARVAINGYGVIGKRVADAVAAQGDMELVGVSDVVIDYRLRVAAARGREGSDSSGFRTRAVRRPDASHLSWATAPAACCVFPSMRFCLSST